MTITATFSEQLSEQWLLERTYHAQLRNGKELSVPDLTLAMKQLIDFPVPPPSQSWDSKLPERLPLKKSTNFYVPLSTWKEITQAEAQATYQQGIPVLLYSEHTWENPPGSSNTWGANKNMRALIYGNTRVHADEVSGTDFAVCYLDLHRGTFSNDVWKAWFSSDTAVIFDGSAASAATFLGPCFQFPYTTHNTVIASDGHVHEYVDIAGAIQGFQSLPPRKTSKGGQDLIIFPQFCFYHEVKCPSGVYRIEFFGPHMDEMGYATQKAA